MTAAVVMPQVSPATGKSDRLRVLTLTPFFPSVQDPAQGCFVAEPISRLEQFDVTSPVLAVRPFYRSSQDACLAGSEWRQYASLPGNVGLVTSAMLLTAAVRNRVLEMHRASPIRLVHAHAALPCGEAAMLLARELRVPFVVSVHGLDVFSENQAGQILGMWTKRRSLRVYREARRVVCISKKVSEALPIDLRPKVLVVYNGVDSEMFTPATKEPTPGRILSVGNLIPIKGHELLLRAFARVSGQMPGIELEIIGDGPERERLVALAATLGVGSLVAFRDRQNRLAVAKAMQNCAIFALPSRYEALGCVYLEAMACAKPTVACSGQGIEEVIRNGENGVLIKPADETALGDVLLALLRDPGLRSRLGAAARQTILQRHALERQASALADLYRECVS